MKKTTFQELFKKSKSKSRDDKSTVVHDYTQLINDIASMREYPHWFNPVRLNMIICGLRNASFRFNRYNAKTFDIIWIILSDWLPNYNAQEIANSLLALDQMGLRWRNFDTDLQAMLLDSVRSNVDTFNSQNIANSLLALDQMGLRWRNFDTDLQADLLDSVRRNIARFNAQNISNSLLALDQMGLRWSHFDAGLQADLLDSVRRNIARFNAQNIANSLLALDQMGLKWVNFDTGLQAKILDSVSNNILRFNAQDIANSLLALGQLGLRWRDFDADLQAKLLDSVRSNVETFNEQEIANSLLALDQMGLVWRNFDTDLQAKLLDSVRRKIDTFNSQNIANSLLALSRLHIDNDGILELLINPISSIDSLTSIQANQILLALTWIKTYRGKSYDIAERFKPHIKIKDSRLHQDVIRIINECNIIVEKEKRMGVKGIISVDCYIPNKNLVIEVHGPSHYSVDGSLNVKSEKQAELIKKLGFQYQVISYKTWDGLKDDNAKKAFIKILIPSQLNISASIFRPRNHLDPNTRPFRRT